MPAIHTPLCCCSAKPTVENINQEHEPILIKFCKNNGHRVPGLFSEYFLYFLRDLRFCHSSGKQHCRFYL